MDRNQHVKEYLQYYIKLPHPPHFAVLLNGPWGIGKTFFVKNFFKSYSDNIRLVYVSLYGLSSFDEIDDAIFRAMYPLLDNKGVKIAGRALKSFGKYVGASIDLNITEVLNKANADIFVFDDLERCELSAKKALGYINEFVEHENRKVIIIANEREIGNYDDYLRIREKVVGKVLEMQSAFERALEAFISSVDDPQIRSFFDAKKTLISEIYHQSELRNLRVVQQTMWDFQRFYVSLDDKHRNSDAAMTMLLRLLFALSFELKAGRIGENDLIKRDMALLTSWMSSRRERREPLPLARAQDRYPGIDLDSSVLSDETLLNFLIKGIVPSDQIRAELDRSSFFVEVAKEPSWRTIWHAFERTDEEFCAALREMERAFAAREFTVSGEILHVLGLRLWLSKANILDTSFDNVIAEGREYIDDLYEAGKLEPLFGHDDTADTPFGVYDGLGIHQSETREYQELYSYLIDKRHEAAANHYPKIAHELISNMRADADHFFRRITLTGEGPNDLYNVPVLAALDPSDFVSEWRCLHPAQQRTILIALKTRYEQGKLGRELKEERRWATDVRNLLHAEAEM